MSIQTVSAVPQTATAAGINASGSTTATKPQPDAVTANANAVKQDTSPAPVPVVETAPRMEQIQEALAEVQQTLSPVARNLLFSLDEDSGKTIVKVVDSSTDEVIRQIPSEEIVAISKALDKLQGLLLKQQA